MKHVDLSAAPDPRVTLEHVNCPLGCDDGDVPVLTGRDRISNLPGQFQVLRCGGCGLLRTSPRPSPQTIGFYYPEDYGPYVDTRISSAGRGCLPALRQRMVALGQRLFDTKAHAIPAMPAGRMLEIGCASGSYLNKMASEGWEVEGIEFSAAAAAAARAQGFAVHVGPVETADRPNGGYDLVVGWMVLEHLHDPVGALRNLARWTRPGGMLAISVPNTGAAEFRLFGSRWYALQLPNHLFHFDRRTLTVLLEAGGWEMVRVQHQRTLANALGSLGYVAQDRGYKRLGQWLIDFAERGGRFGALAQFLPALVLAALGQTGRMTVWAQRR